MSDETAFTCVFAGNLREFPGNPLQTATPFGVPSVVAMGDGAAVIDRLTAALNEIRTAAMFALILDGGEERALQQIADLVVDALSGDDLPSVPSPEEMVDE